FYCTGTALTHTNLHPPVPGRALLLPDFSSHNAPPSYEILKGYLLLLSTVVLPSVNCRRQL
ncbi:MAG TPA: hypothetical protein VLH85_01210, partial [Levilinea sp.]|nr:hypothetical protein [Levilinea sp.]